MNCEQTSGIFLNRSCANEATKQCYNCERKVCKKHHHLLDGQKLCEDCYWEFFLYSEEKRLESTTTLYDTRDSNSRTASGDSEGFEGGFGGGEFGGGGASGGWTAGDKEGFTASDMDAGTGLADSDNDTFFYS